MEMVKRSVTARKWVVGRGRDEWVEEKIWEAVTDLTWGGSKITVDSACNHESKRHWLLGRKAMANLDSILKSRDITLSTKVHLIKAIVLPVVMYGCESLTTKKAEH